MTHPRRLITATRGGDERLREYRLRDVCGLYVDPPANVLVVSIDEETGIQGIGSAPR